MSIKTGKWFIAFHINNYIYLFAVHKSWRFDWFVKPQAKPEKVRFYTGPFELEISDWSVN